VDCWFDACSLAALHPGAHDAARSRPDGTYAADAKPLPGWAERARKAHYNAVENLAPFAAVVLVAQLAQATNSTTAAAAVVYFLSRIVHYVGYLSGIPFVRTLAFGVGWDATMVIFLVIVT